MLLYHYIVSGYWHTATVNRLVQWGLATSASVSTWIDDHNSMSISVGSPLDETLNEGPLGAALVATV